MKRKKDLCRPCAELAREKYNLTTLTVGVNRKITCEMCHRRRYGSLYELRKKVTA